VTTESGRLALPGGFVTYEARTLRWAPHPPAAVAGFSHPIAPGECVCRPDLGWELELGAPEPWGSHRGLPSGPSLAVFDAAHLPAALEVRSMQPGDRIRPMGVAGRQKLQDLFTDHKVARSRRTLWPALAAGQEVLWVPELRRGSAALVGPTTAAVVRARFRRDRDPS
jgi:tRNA(Ile)-lysidine synthetase-like protein